MDERRARQLAECYRLLDETGDLAACLERHPELETELRAHLALRRELSQLAGDDPETALVASKRRLLLSSVHVAPLEGENMRWKPNPRLAALLGGLGLFAIAALGVGAASGTVGMPNVLGTNISHSTSMADTENGTAEATETEAEDSATAVETRKAGGTEAPAPLAHTPSPNETPNHGQSVSQAVHTAIAGSTPGEDRGSAVSEAACTAAHDRSTLPEGAQNAPGQDGRTPKDCTHPNADGTPGNGHGNGNDINNNANEDNNSGNGPQNNNGQGHGNGNGAGHGNH